MKHVKFVKQTTLLLSTFLTLNICFMGEASEYWEKAKKHKIGDHVVLDEAHGISELSSCIRKDLETQSEACERYCSYFARHLRPNFKNKDLLHPGLFQEKRLCKRDFHDRYEKKRRIYLKQKYLSLCAGRSFDEQWSYDPKNETRHFTDEEHKLRRDPEIRKCSEKCVAQYALAKRAIYCMDNPKDENCPIFPHFLAYKLYLNSKTCD